MSIAPLLKISPLFSNRELICLVKSKKSLPLKNKTKGLLNVCGRNHQGKITIRHHGKGSKKSYRQIDSFSFLSSSFVVEQLEYDPNRGAKIARVFSSVSKTHAYFIASSSLEVGYFSQKQTLTNSQLELAGPISTMPLGSLICCIGTNFRLFQCILQKAVGTFGQVIQKGEYNSVVKLHSGKKILLLSKAWAVLGIIPQFSSEVRNAGRNRRKNIRPAVRGVAMNSIDHPHGGGEGKSSPGRPSVTLWGKPAHGRKRYNK
jgi:large subunit ribosomal protein L2